MEYRWIGILGIVSVLAGCGMQAANPASKDALSDCPPITAADALSAEAGDLVFIAGDPTAFPSLPALDPWSPIPTAKSIFLPMEKADFWNFTDTPTAATSDAPPGCPPTTTATRTPTPAPSDTPTPTETATPSPSHTLPSPPPPTRTATMTKTKLPTVSECVGPDKTGCR